MPLLRAAHQLLRRKRLPAEQLVGAVPGLAAWPEAHHIATMIASPGADATETTFAIVAKLHAVTPDTAKRLYTTWWSKLRR